MNELAGWIKERRKNLGLSQAQLATKLGLNQGHVSHLENGKILPDADMMTKIDAVIGKFSGEYTPDTTPKKVHSAKEALKAYREAKEDAFCLQIDTNIFITADRHQYILKQGANASYFTDLTSLTKYLVVSQVRQSAVNSVQEICNKIDEVYKLIEKKFMGFDPAGVAVSSREEIIPVDDE